MRVRAPWRLGILVALLVQAGRSAFPAAAYAVEPGGQRLPYGFCRGKLSADLDPARALRRVCGIPLTS